jgi:hypothetical protein
MQSCQNKKLSKVTSSLLLTDIVIQCTEPLTYNSPILFCSTTRKTKLCMLKLVVQSKDWIINNNKQTGKHHHTKKELKLGMWHYFMCALSLGQGRSKFALLHTSRYKMKTSRLNSPAELYVTYRVTYKPIWNITITVKMYVNVVANQ